MPVLSGWTSPLNVGHLPSWAQFVIFETGSTFLGYWLHRFDRDFRDLQPIHLAVAGIIGSRSFGREFGLT
jgi:hypothetical protein